MAFAKIAQFPLELLVFKLFAQGFVAIADTPYCYSLVK